MVQRLSCCRSYSAAHKERTDGQTLPTRCEEREDDHEEFVEYKTDPKSSCKIEPEPWQLEIRSRRLALACGNTRLLHLCDVFPQLHARACAPCLLALLEGR